MRVFAFDFSMGNWDAWTFEVGQNMYIYKPDGQRWMLLPWDIDFTFGVDGRGTSVALRAGQDSVMNRAYSNPTFLRMNWRAYQDIVNGPFLAQNFQPQIDARRAALLKNGVGGLSDPRSITTWINARRTYILGQLNTADTKLFAITSNGIRVRAGFFFVLAGSELFERAREGATRGASPSIFAKCGGHGASPKPSASSRAASSSSFSSEPA